MAEPSRSPRAAEDWSAAQYLKFEDERTRPSRDLLAQVPLDAPRRVIDLGCGPGNSTELLVERFPSAEVIGVDSSPDMLRQARERLPRRKFIEADLSTWTPEPGTDLLFGNSADAAAAIGSIVEGLTQLRDALERGDREYARSFLRAARSVRSELS